eukprot:3747227-Rhodomonas_salina.1
MAKQQDCHIKEAGYMHEVIASCPHHIPLAIAIFFTLQCQSSLCSVSLVFLSDTTYHLERDYPVERREHLAWQADTLPIAEANHSTTPISRHRQWQRSFGGGLLVSSQGFAANLSYY